MPEIKTLRCIKWVNEAKIHLSRPKSRVTVTSDTRVEEGRRMRKASEISEWVEDALVCLQKGKLGFVKRTPWRIRAGAEL